MSLKGTRLRIVESYRRRAENFRVEKRTRFSGSLGCYCIIAEIFGAWLRSEAAVQSRRVAGLGKISPTDLVI